MNILYVNGHPDPKSFHAAIRDSYLSGVNRDKHVVEVLNLGELHFDPVLRFGYRERMPEDTVITRSQELVKWADHIIFSYPMWWGSPPSLLMGWIARVFTPGFSYNVKSLLKFTGHLKGKTADLIITSRVPRIIWWFVGNNGVAMFTGNLLLLTGMKKRKILILDSMSLKKDTLERRQKFLEKVKKSASKL